MKLFAGPCVLEQDSASALSIARQLVKLREQGVEVTFKGSFDKANRTRLGSFRGPGLVRGLAVLEQVKRETGLEVTTDIHEAGQAESVATVASVIQIPALLSRQTDLITAAAKTGRAVNIKKGQFMSPDDVCWAVEKARQGGAAEVYVTERGVMFGYNNLVVDPRSLVRLLELGRREAFEVIFDGSHSIQTPSANQGCSGGERRMIAPLCRAAVAIGVENLFLETWPDSPDQAPCDGPIAFELEEIAPLMCELQQIAHVIRS